MSDLQLIKSRIYTEQKVEELLEALGCEHVRRETGERVVAQLPSSFHSSNRRSVQVKYNENLTAHIRSRDISGDIYSIVGYIIFDADTFDAVRDNISRIKEWVCQALGYYEFLGFGWGEKKERDWNSWLRPIQRARQKDEYTCVNEVLDTSVLNQFIDLPHLLWYQDGINLQTQRQFGVMFDITTERIVYPVHNAEGQLIGIKGRYVGNNEMTLSDMKYFPIYTFSKSQILYNLHRALPHIRERGEVIVVESAKSCMLLTQWGYPWCVSLEGKSMSPSQVRLLKDLKATIVLALDKDVSDDEIERITKEFRSRLVYVVRDKKNILINSKSSPVDMGERVWYDLYVSRYKII